MTSVADPINRLEEVSKTGMDHDGQTLLICDAIQGLSFEGMPPTHMPQTVPFY